MYFSKKLHFFSIKKLSLLTFTCVVLMCFLQNLNMLNFPLTCLISYFFSCLNFNIMIVQSTTCVFECAKFCQNAKQNWGCKPTQGFVWASFWKISPRKIKGFKFVLPNLKNTFLQVVKQHYDTKKNYYLTYLVAI